jgi:hypothetical protein
MFDLSLRATQGLLAAITVMILPFCAAAEDTNSSSAAPAETFSAAAVMDTELDSSRGAFAPDTINFNNFSATNVGNSVTGGFTGNNSLTNGSFNNSNGLVNVIQNSGNNVIIQSSTIVSMTFNK